MQEQCARYKRYKRVYINIGVHLHYAEPAGRHVPCGVAYPAAEYAKERYAEELLRVRSSYSGISSSPVKRAIGSVVSIAKKVIRRIRKKLENLCT